MQGCQRRPAPEGHGGRARAILGLAAAGLALAACSGGVLDPHGPVGANEAKITYNALAIMLAIVVPTILVAFAFAWWFRASNSRADYRPEWVYSGRVELIVWSIPILVILFLGGVIWVGSHQLDPARSLPSPRGVPPQEIQVVALDWKWLFIYPREGIATVNEVVVPTGEPVHFRITSGSVMNTFFVPQLGGMIYAMNGMVTNLNLQADRPGAYYGRSAQFSGDGFPDMHFTLHSVPAEQFASWVAATRAHGPTLDLAAYNQLAQQSHDVAPFSFRSVLPDLFESVLDHRAPPGPGPRQGHGGTGVREVTGASRS